MNQTGTSSKGAARRAEILDAAYRVLSEEGHSGASLRAIAREVGMDSAHVLYYFGSREDLLREVIKRWDEESWELAAGDGRGDGLSVFVEATRRNLKIKGIVHVYLTFAAEAVDPAHAAHSYFQDRFARVHALLADAIRQRQTAGSIHSEVDADRAARALIALSDGLQLQALVDPKVDAPAGVEAAIVQLATHEGHRQRHN